MADESAMNLFPIARMLDLESAAFITDVLEEAFHELRLFLDRRSPLRKPIAPVRSAIGSSAVTANRRVL
jgi:hypothetical protein